MTARVRTIGQDRPWPLREAPRAVPSPVVRQVRGQRGPETAETRSSRKPVIRLIIDIVALVVLCRPLQQVYLRTEILGVANYYTDYTVKCIYRVRDSADEWM